nr:PREDICTED: ubiquitin-conjugating enzyme E2 E3 [Latimeria chalumnae]|eukprot:XP_014346802.1 PREDICTED: ubiquitin-conjugating enzyme E2 E3 [Latimeria chalumnae]
MSRAFESPPPPRNSDSTCSAAPPRGSSAKYRSSSSSDSRCSQSGRNLPCSRFCFHRKYQRLTVLNRNKTPLKMSTDRQRSDDESPSTSSGSSDADQRDPAAPEPEEQEERKQPSATQHQKKNTKLSSKTTAKLSTSAKRIQKELAEITLDPPPNCRYVSGILFGSKD